MIYFLKNLYFVAGVALIVTGNVMMLETTNVNWSKGLVIVGIISALFGVYQQIRDDATHKEKRKDLDRN